MGETAQIELTEVHASLLAFVRDLEHPVQRDASVSCNVGWNGNLIDDLPFGQVFERPEQMRRIDTEHGGAEAAAIVEWDDEAIRILLLQTIHQVDLCPDGKS